MFIYLDSSVLIKKYFDEFASQLVVKIWNENKYVAISHVGYSEILGTVNKKQKIENYSDKVKSSITKKFKNDWGELIKINVDQSINLEFYNYIKYRFCNSIIYFLWQTLFTYYVLRYNSYSALT